MSDRLALHNYLPDACKLMKEIDSIVKEGIDPRYLEIIKIRVSQLNGCAYCLNIHTNDAINLGEDPQRLYVLSAWREALKWFTEEEQTILQITEEVTLIGQHGVADATYARAITLFGEKKLAHILLAAISINSWTRIGVSLHLHPLKQKK